MKKSEITSIVIALLLAAVIGGLIGDLIGTFIPEGAVRILFKESINIGFKAISFDFYSISLTFGLMVKINFVSILMVILVIVYFRWWYL
ncbi:MAG: hypothetical protein A2W07_09125 [candidate division Zixibacteria bacterium RBG_16_43_9]|nr:DUF4321 domain-containing protein [candidate division Zixibacteria bacterium]OGC83138.1 MAG: hypothetical protein A2W07_09125 [candidate division Zixibacteria bacterium RBG_16_43_9]